jgi:hypothetical protein
VNRGKLITVLFTESEYNTIEKKAAAMGKSVEDTIRELALSRKKRIKKRTSRLRLQSG